MIYQQIYYSDFYFIAAKKVSFSRFFKKYAKFMKNVATRSLNFA